jgi:hypothetical protein
MILLVTIALMLVNVQVSYAEANKNNTFVCAIFRPIDRNTFKCMIDPSLPDCEFECLSNCLLNPIVKITLCQPSEPPRMIRRVRL